VPLWERMRHVPHASSVLPCVHDTGVAVSHVGARDGWTLPGESQHKVASLAQNHTGHTGGTDHGLGTMGIGSCLATGGRHCVLLRHSHLWCGPGCGEAGLQPSTQRGPKLDCRLPNKLASMHSGALAHVNITRRRSAHCRRGLCQRGGRVPMSGTCCKGEHPWSHATHHICSQ
jgi:hypothetical protein